jgi:transcriptional regulator with XRE-family HTH domain
VMSTPLKAARVATGWSQPQAIQRLRHLAADLGEGLPQTPTLRVQLSRWENGHRRPGGFYRHLFCQLYQRAPEQLGFPASPDGAGTQVVGIEAMTALLYAAPLTLTQLRTVPPARVRLYTELALADPRTPTPVDLTTGLRQAQVEATAWLDRERLRACQAAAHRAQATTLPVNGAGQVPDWVTTGRLVGSTIAAAVFTNHSG